MFARFTTRLRQFSVLITFGVTFGSATCLGYYYDERTYNTAVNYFGDNWRGLSALAGVSASISLGIAYGPTVAARLMGVGKFLQDPRMKVTAIATMRDPTKSVHVNYGKEKLLNARQDTCKQTIAKIKTRIGTPRCLTISGMKETGKSELMMDVAEQLSAGGIPAMYIRAQENESTFAGAVLQSFDVLDDIASVKGLLQQIQWANIKSLFLDICRSIDGPSVVIIDGISSKLDPQFLYHLESLARQLSESYKPTVVVLVTSDSTDLFLMKNEARRDITTLTPFNDAAMQEYLSVVCNVQQEDIAEAMRIVNQEFTPSLIEVQKLFADQESRIGGRLDFDEISRKIKTKQELTKTNIQISCNMDKESMQELKAFAHEKGASFFFVTEWFEKFGDFRVGGSIGHTLLKSNYMLYLVEEQLLMIYAPIVRHAIAQIV